MMAINGTSATSPSAANFSLSPSSLRAADNGTQDAAAPQGNAANARDLMSAITDLFKAVSAQSSPQGAQHAPAASKAGSPSDGAKGSDDSQGGLLKMITQLLEAIVGMLGGKSGAAQADTK